MFYFGYYNSLLTFIELLFAFRSKEFRRASLCQGSSRMVLQTSHIWNYMIASQRWVLALSSAIQMPFLGGDTWLWLKMIYFVCFSQIFTLPVVWATIPVHSCKRNFHIVTWTLSLKARFESVLWLQHGWNHKTRNSQKQCIQHAQNKQIWSFIPR